ncbi:MAG: ImmA/IrrE family metallo-endopeptidase [Planctomycetota bacterium]|nr:ImmA/IrrE family metallo-endopeptidase [Planctomycetota bacterium]
MNKVTVNPKLLQWASDRSSKGQSELEGRFPKLGLWLAGEDAPTLNQLEQFSKATATPLGFLFLKSPPVERLEIPHYRTLNDKIVRAPSTELLDTLHTMQRRQAWLHDYLLEEGREQVSLVKCANPKENVNVVAGRVRDLLKLESNWAAQSRTWSDALRVLQDAMSEAGIVVVVNGVVGNNTHRVLDVEEFRGFVLVDNYAPLVFINGADSKSAQMFTLAHELAHVAFGSSAAFDLRQMQPAGDAIEQACNRVAAEFLVPEALLRKMWKDDEDDPYDTVARTFKVSQIVAARRLLDLALITRDDFLEFYRRYVSQERKQKDLAASGGNFHATSPQRVGKRFAMELVRALGEGRILHTEAYRLTGLSGKSFRELAQRAQESGLD